MRGEYCWLWDEDKFTEKEALKKYPPEKYKWVLIEDLPCAL